MIFFLTETKQFGSFTSSKSSEIWLRKVCSNTLKLTLFGQIPGFSEIFPKIASAFLKVLTTCTKECMIQKSKESIRMNLKARSFLIYYSIDAIIVIYSHISFLFQEIG